MADAQHDLAHLLSLIEAANAQAAKLGDSGRSVSGLLDRALLGARALDTRSGSAKEGLRPEDLTTDNDK